jgi:hypothetical protein
VCLALVFRQGHEASQQVLMPGQAVVHVVSHRVRFLPGCVLCVSMSIITTTTPCYAGPGCGLFHELCGGSPPRLPMLRAPDLYQGAASIPMA